MRISRSSPHEYPTLTLGVLLHLFLLCGAGCGPVGQDPEPTGPLRILHIVFLDQKRGLNPDLLNNQPGRACSSIEPCLPPLQCGQLVFNYPSNGSLLTVDVPDPPTGDICHDPENILEVEPSVDSVIRVAFDQHIDLTGLELPDGNLDPALFTLTTTTDPPIPIPGVVRYDRSGSPDFSSDPNAFPYGPAIVFDPAEPLAPATEYRITLDTPRLRSRSVGGSAIPASQGTHRFTTEPLRVLDYLRCPAANGGGCANVSEFYFAFPDPEGLDPPEVAPNQALAFQFTADVLPETLDRVRVEDADGNLVPARATPLILDPDSECPPAPARIIYVVPVDASGQPSTWNPGSYRLLVAGGASGAQARDGGARAVGDHRVDFTVTDIGTEVDEGDPFAIGVNVLVCP
ncbi:MAG TPA: hypothetical protein VH877_25645 [Polyangia bacterium]|jgi:hypothetical protein|nr:hypothetical protein [Polyangia bacterium]